MLFIFYANPIEEIRLLVAIRVVITTNHVSGTCVKAVNKFPIA
jgi:hypothetical protein